MAAGSDSLSGPFNNQLFDMLQLEQDAHIMGFRYFGASSDSRSIWTTPSGRVVHVTIKELRDLVELNRKSWWAREAAKWQGE